MASSHRQPQGKLAFLMDFENLILGLENNEPASDKPFSISTVIQFLEQQHGGVLYRKAFADWSNPRFRKYAQDMTRAGVEMQHVVRSGFNGKNAIDTHLVIQAMDCLQHYPNLDTFVVATGDGEFLPLVVKLKASGRKVVGLGAQGTAASTLVENCDEFLYCTPKGVVVPRPRSVADAAPVRQAVQSVLAAEGPLPVRRLYGFLKEQIPNFLPRNYGFNNIFDLLRQQPAVTLFVREDGEEAVCLNEGGGVAPTPAATPPAATAPPPAPAVAATAEEEGAGAPTAVPMAAAAEAGEAAPQRFADYMTNTRWFIREPRMRHDILDGIFQQLQQRSGSLTLDELRQQVDPSRTVTDKEWFGTLFSLIHGGCLWEDPGTSEKPMDQRAVSLFRGVHELDEFITRYYCSLFHKAANERADITPQLCAQLMYGDTAPEHIALFELVLRRLKSSRNP
ncbi:MAG: NYN domain-containing protein [Lentisphaeria bacterium]|jgi:hypothetical protein